MKSSHVIIILLVLVLLAVLVFAGKDREADTGEDLNINLNTPADNSAPTSGASGDTEVTETGEVKEFVVEGKNFAFTPNVISVNRGDRVRIVFRNTEGFHDFRIDEYAAVTAQTRAPAEEVLEFTADKVGAFEFYCSVGTHREMGMTGTLNVN